MGENKRDRFIRVAETRTNKIIKLMQLLGNCANKNNYDYTEKDAQVIVEALEEELDNIKAKFNLISVPSNKKFKLDK